MLAAIGVTAWQLYEILDDYFSYPVNTRITRQHNKQLNFPSVKICNVNPVRSTELYKDPRLQEILISMGEEKNMILANYENWLVHDFDAVPSTRKKRSVELQDFLLEDSNNEVILNRVKRSAGNTTDPNLNDTTTIETTASNLTTEQTTIDSTTEQATVTDSGTTKTMTRTDPDTDSTTTDNTSPAHVTNSATPKAPTIGASTSAESANSTTPESSTQAPEDTPDPVFDFGMYGLQVDNETDGLNHEMKQDLMLAFYMSLVNEYVSLFPLFFPLSFFSKLIALRHSFSHSQNGPVFCSTFRLEMGHQRNTSILDCAYDGMKCSVRYVCR